MDLTQFVIGFIVMVIGIVIITSPELAVIIAAVLIILGVVAIYDAIFGKGSISN